MKRITLKTTALIIAAALCISLVCTAQETPFAETAQKTAEYILANVQNPQSAQSGGEWSVLALARAEKAENDWLCRYYNNIKALLEEKQTQKLSESKSTENSRVAIALCAIGADCQNVGGYNLLSPLCDFDYVTNQGVNGAAYALIALNAYESKFGEKSEYSEIKQKYTQYIISNETPYGGWSLSGDVPDADVTSMALQALYNSGDETVKTAADKAFEVLSKMQLQTGGFANFGTENAESCAQVLCAMSTYKISADDERFVKNGKTVIDALLMFYNPQNGGFCHVLGFDSGIMSTEQAAYAFVAYSRFLNGQNALFDMSDVKTLEPGNSNSQTDVQTGDAPEITHADGGEKQENEPKTETESEPENEPDKAQSAELEPKKKTVVFDDVTKNDWYAEFVDFVCENEIMDGVGENKFAPEENVTRAEIAAVLYRMKASPKINKKCLFTDVVPESWYESAVAWAAQNGIVTGCTADTFAPNDYLTRQQLAAVLTRYTELCGVTLTESDTAASYADYKSVENYAKAPMSKMVNAEILSGADGELLPFKSTTRAELAAVLTRCIKFIENRQKI